MSTRLLSFALLLTTALVSPAALAEPKYPATVDVFGGVNGDGPGGGLELIAPFAEGEGSLLFGLARGSLWDETGAGGIGLGYRSQALPGWILGGYGMVDYHHGASNQGYFQGVLGLEALTESFDFRINGYLPEDEETTLANVMGAAPPPPPGVMVGDIVIVDHEIGIVTGASAGSAGFYRSFERPLPGIDAEIGYRLPIPGHDFRIFLGAFHFDDGDYDSVTGPKVRAELRIHDLDLFGNNSRLTLEAGIRDDDVRGTDASAGVRIRIPFGGVPSNQRGHELAGLDQRMLDPIRREDHIVMGEREEEQAASPGGIAIEAVKSVETGNEITSIWFADGAGGGDGTQGNETDLGTAVTGAGMGGLIVALGGSGDLIGNVTLADNQILLGGASSLQIMGLTTGNMATYATGGTRPNIIDGSLAPVSALSVAAAPTQVIVLGNGNLLAGLNVRGVNNGVLVDPLQEGSIDRLDAAIYGYGIDGLIVRDVDVQESGSGLLLDLSTNVQVSDFSHSIAGTDPLGSNSQGFMIVRSSNVAAEDVSVTGSRLCSQFSLSSNITLSRLTANNCTRALTLARVDGGTIEDVTVQYGLSGGADGVSIDALADFPGLSTNIQLKNIQITGLSAADPINGLRIFGADGVTVTGLTVTNATQGVEITDSSNVTIGDAMVPMDVSIQNVKTDAIKIARSTGVTVQNFTVDNGTGNGVSILGDPSASYAVTVQNGAISNLNGSAVTSGVLVLAKGSGGGIQIKNVSISNVSDTISSNGVFLSGASNVTLDNVDVDGTGGGGSPVTKNGLVIASSTNVTVKNNSEFRDLSGFGITLQDSSGVSVDDFQVANTGATGILVGAGTGNSFTNGTVTGTGSTSAYLDAGGILIQGAAGKTTEVALTNIDVIGADSPGANAYGVAVIPAGTPTTVSVTLNDVDVDGGAGSVTTLGYLFQVGGSSTLTLGGMGNDTVNVPSACQVIGSPTNTVQINGNSEPGTTC